MQTFISTLFTFLPLALSWSIAAQPAPRVIPNPEKEAEQPVRSIPLPPMPGETPHAIYCLMKIGKIPHRDKPLKVDYSRKPGTANPITISVVKEQPSPQRKLSLPALLYTRRASGFFPTRLPIS